LRDAIAGDDSVVVQEDVSLQPGDFMIDTTQTHFDGRVEKQTEALARAMLE
jgi:hypothetical protein